MFIVTSAGNSTQPQNAPNIAHRMPLIAPTTVNDTPLQKSILPAWIQQSQFAFRKQRKKKLAKMVAANKIIRALSAKATNK